VELYDLVVDPEERVDLATTHLQLRAQMETLLAEWERETDRLRQRYWSGDMGADSEEMSPEVLRRLKDLGYLD